jgi:hypothetical protein
MGIWCASIEFEAKITPYFSLKPKTHLNSLDFPPSPPVAPPFTAPTFGPVFGFAIFAKTVSIASDTFLSWDSLKLDGLGVSPDWGDRSGSMAISAAIICRCSTLISPEEEVPANVDAFSSCKWICNY